MLNLYIAIIGNNAKHGHCHAISRTQAERFCPLVLDEEQVPTKDLTKAQAVADAHNYLMTACKLYNEATNKVDHLAITPAFWEYMLETRVKNVRREACKMLCQHVGIDYHKLSRDEALEIYGMHQDDKIVFNLVMGIINL